MDRPGGDAGPVLARPDQFWMPKLVRPDQITSTKISPAGPNFAPDRFWRYSSCHVNFWDSRLESLTVQNKLLDIVSLEQKCPLWRRLMCGLPEKQLSFLLRAGCDTLPTPMNLARWNIIVSPVCSLCSSSQPTTKHILTGCTTTLDQGRYTWRHDSNFC